jgi:hypothetical protein
MNAQHSVIDVRPTGHQKTGWRIAQGAAVVTVIIALLAMVDGVAGNPPALRLAALFSGAGHTLIRGVIAYGVFQRIRWAAWAAGLFALATLPLVVVTLSTRLEVGGTEFLLPPLARVLLVAQFLANAGVLVGLLLVRFGNRSDGPLQPRRAPTGKR